MARKKSILDDLVILPWWFNVALAATFVRKRRLNSNSYCWWAEIAKISHPIPSVRCAWQPL